MASLDIVHDDASGISNHFDGIDLTVTSPPYIDAIDYDQHADSGFSEDFRETDTTDREVEAYFDSMRGIFESLLDATSDGGYCAVVIGGVKTNDGEWYPLPHRFATMMHDLGWNFHETIAWNKVTGGSSRFGVTIQHPYPGYYYPNQQHEEIQVWWKGEITREKNDDSLLDVTTDFMKKEVANNVWHIAPVPPGQYDHPCPFPEELAYRLTSLYTSVGDTVADPFMGSGTTGKVAFNLDRDAVGMEIQEEYIEQATDRIKNEDFDRREQLIPNFDKQQAISLGTHQ